MRLCQLQVRDAVIPSGVKAVGARWFYESAVETVAVPESVRVLGEEAFFGCRRLRRVTLAEASRLEKIGSGCFRESGLEELRVPSGLREIGDRAFYLCQHLTWAELSQGLRSVSAGSFSYSGLEEVLIPASVRTIRSDAFNGCQQLGKVEFAEGSELRLVESGAFAAGVQRQLSIHVPHGVRVEDGAF